MIIVTGGAGFIGSHVVAGLNQAGERDILVVDDLTDGSKHRNLNCLTFADYLDRDELLEALPTLGDVRAIFHQGACSDTTEADGRFMMANNYTYSRRLLEHALRQCIPFLYASSASVYGEPQAIPVVEEHTKTPVNSYGESKLMFEHILQWYGKAYGVKHISFRYFNAAGASRLLGEDHRPETHLIANILKAAMGKDKAVPIFGVDYPTKDGSCIRDYVHVVDIARAHILALGKLEELSGRAYNLGNGEGYSVLEVVEMTKKVTGVDIPTKVGGRRPGDPAVLVASSSRAKSELGWKPKFPELENIIEDAWNWMKQHPNGYEQ